MTKLEKHLIVGDFTIRVTNLLPEEVAYGIPKSATAFEDEYSHSAPIFDYTMEEAHLNEQEGKTLLVNYDIGPYPLSIYQASNGDLIWIRYYREKGIRLVYYISKDWKSWRLLCDHTLSDGKDSFLELFNIFAYSILDMEAIVFHGVVLEWRNFGVVFCAASGVGKTTHTRMWRDHEGATILNGDRALCRKEAECWYAYGAPWCGSSKEYKNSKVPLKVIVILEQADKNEVEVLSSAQGALELMSLAFAPDWNMELMNYAFDSIDHIVQNIMILKLKCRPEQEAVDVLKETLEQLFD